MDEAWRFIVQYKDVISEWHQNDHSTSVDKVLLDLDPIDLKARSLYLTPRRKLSSVILRYVSDVFERFDYEISSSCGRCELTDTERAKELARLGQLVGQIVCYDEICVNIYGMIDRCQSIVLKGKSFIDSPSATENNGIGCCSSCLRIFATNVLGELNFASVNILYPVNNEHKGNPVYAADISEIDIINFPIGIYFNKTQADSDVPILSYEQDTLQKIEHNFRSGVFSTGAEDPEWPPLTHKELKIDQSERLYDAIIHLFADSMLKTFDEKFKDSDEMLEDKSGNASVQWKHQPKGLGRFFQFMDAYKNTILMDRISQFLIREIAYINELMLSEISSNSTSRVRGLLGLTLRQRLFSRFLGYASSRLANSDSFDPVEWLKHLIDHQPVLFVFAVQSAIECANQSFEPELVLHMIHLLEDNKLSQNQCSNQFLIHTRLLIDCFIYRYKPLIYRYRDMPANPVIIPDICNKMSTLMVDEFLYRFADFLTFSQVYRKFSITNCGIDLLESSIALRSRKESRMSYQIHFETLFFTRHPAFIEKAIHFVSDWFCNSSIAHIKGPIAQELIEIFFDEANGTKNTRASHHLSCAISQIAIENSRKASVSIKNLLAAHNVSSSCERVVSFLCSHHTKAKIFNWAKKNGNVSALIEQPINGSFIGTDKFMNAVFTNEENLTAQMFDISEILVEIKSLIGCQIKGAIVPVHKVTEVLKKVIAVLNCASRFERHLLMKAVIDLLLVDALYSRFGQSTWLIQNYRYFHRNLSFGERNWLTFHKERRCRISKGCPLTAVQIANIRRIKYL